MDALIAVVKKKATQHNIDFSTDDFIFDDSSINKDPDIGRAPEQVIPSDINDINEIPIESD